ncbi:MAG: chitobiase/beta-hexosaminidase C-terminal domain-containing protein, partial [Oscillospiraceae bacterium]|nr:chitobiase/beta-hexosaminidase C-terminal domain-containing protein [Oscillospiraceae bacterium]
SEKFGLFYTLTDATVKNLGITNVKIKSEKSVGALTNGCKGSVIENCYVTGSIESDGHAGGLVGYDTGAVKDKNTLTNCVNMASVKSNKYSAFGIIKSESKDVLKNCVNYGNITGYNAAAGVCDRVGTNMVSCYNLGKVVSTGDSEKVGGLAYYVAETLENCATCESTFTHSTSADCKAEAKVNVSKSAFKKADTYVGFDFGKTWTINSKINSGRPVLTIMLKDYNGSRPTASNPAGSYKTSVKVELTTDIEGGVIRYTTNGKTPTASSTKYTKTLTIKKNTTVKAAVFVDGVRAKVITLKYTIK